MNSQLTGYRQQIFQDRYSLKDSSGNALESTPEEMFKRVAKGIAAVESTDVRAMWESEFEDLLTDFKFVPGGRILAGAGSGHQVTLVNCYVIPSPEDSRGGIFDNIKVMTEIMARGGGVGVNLSTLRPRGSYIKKVNGFSSGPISWAELYSVTTGGVIQQGGSRRGALMIVLDDDHPDIMEFITAKRIDPLTNKPVALNHANVSVAVSDKFMQAVKNDGDWQTEWPTRAMWEVAHREGDVETLERYNKWKLEGNKYPTYKAREIWDAIAEAAWRSAEPGLLFMERAQRESNTWYYENIRSTNPCVTGDSLVATPSGWLRADAIAVGDEIATVLGRGIVDEVESHENTAVFRVCFSDGSEVTATAAHQFHAVQRRNKEDASPNVHYNKRYLPFRLDELAVGDTVRVAPALMPNLPVVGLPVEYTEREFGFVLGALLGDGCITPNILKNNRVKFAIDTREVEFNELVAGFFRRISPVHSAASEGFGANLVANKDMAQLVRESLLIPSFSYEKNIPLAYQNTNREFLSGLLDGLYSTDGNVNLSSTHPQLRLKTSSRELALDIRRVLLMFGIHGRINSVGLPQSKINGRTITARHSQYEVIVYGDGFRIFSEQIGLSHPAKAARLREAQLEYALTGNTWNTRIVSIEPAGMATVYDLHEPVSDTWITEGYVSRGCGEQFLGPYGVCNLGAMNLSAYVYTSQENGILFDFNNLRHDVQVAVRFLDNAIDANYAFLEENERAQQETRRTGLGTMGIADTLIKLGLRYGSAEADEFIARLYTLIRNAAYEASTDLAKEKGAFGKFDAAKYLQGPFIKNLPQTIRLSIARYGIRNALLLTQAPTGTTSTLAGVSSGIEPIFAFFTQRKDRLGTHVIKHPLVQEFYAEHGEEAELPDYFVESGDLSPEDHIKVQARIQEFTDSSISKTVNGPNSHTVEDVQRLYMLAYDSGCKGVTYYRDGSRDAVLTNMKAAEAAPEAPGTKEEAKLATDTPATLRQRPDVVHGFTRRVKAPEGTVNVTVNSDQDGPIEVFINIGRSGSDIAALAEALGRLISLNLQIPSPMSPDERLGLVAEQLSGIGGSRFVGWGPNRTISLPDATAKALVNAVEVQELLDSDIPAPQAVSSKGKRVKTGNICPECSQLTLVKEEGCTKCLNEECGFSAC